MVSEEPTDQLSIIVWENVSENKKTLLAQGRVEFLTGGSLKLVLLFWLNDTLGRIQEEDKGPHFEFTRVGETEILNDKASCYLE